MRDWDKGEEVLHPIDVFGLGAMMSALQSPTEEDVTRWVSSSTW